MLLLRFRQQADPEPRAWALSDAARAVPARRRWVLHPFLIAIFPILSLYAHNISETSPRLLVTPIGLALAGTSVLWMTFWLLSRDRQRGALAASLIVVLFYAFHHCALTFNSWLDALSQYWVPRQHHVHPLLVLAVLTAAAAPMLNALFRRLKNPAPLTTYLNAFALTLVALPIASAILSRINEPARPIIHSGAGIPTAAAVAERPDIYYIILDAYARSDVMKEVFGYDNEPFLKRLEQKGFYVGRQSTSNYCMTSLSLCSALNADYVDKLIAPATNDREPTARLIRDNLVVRSLRPHGYKFVAFASGYDLTECPAADSYLFPRHPASNFHMMLIRMTPLKFLPMKAEFWDFYSSIRERILFVLDHLPDVATEDGPTFAFVHIVAPHHPFVFGENGEDISPRRRWASVTGGSRHRYFGGPEEYRENYPRQAKFLSRRIEATIDRILADSPKPPIIILQSDHGSGYRHHLDDLEKTDLHERMSILNCYYFPGRKYERLYPSITPVNSFRVVLNTYFGTNLPLLEDRNLFSKYSQPFDLTDVTDRLRTDQDQGKTYTAPSFYPGMVH